MASATVRYKFADGESLLVQVTGETTFPDALDQMRLTAMQLYAEAMGVTLAAGVEDED